MPEPNLYRTLQILCENGIEFIVGGELAAALHGAFVRTLEVAVVHSREPENVERLLKLLPDLDAIFRMQPERRLRPAASDWGSGHLNLQTRYPPLDLLATIGLVQIVGDLR